MIKINKNKLVVIEAIIIVILAIWLITYYQKPQSTQPIVNNTGLLSPRVYAGLIKQQNHLPFNMKPLEEAISNHISQNNLHASVYIENLRDGSNIGINEDTEFDPLSLNKLPIAIIILRKVEKGELSLDTQLTLRDHAANNQSGSLYKHVGENRTIKELLHYMLSESDNTATFALLDKITLSEVEDLSTYLNYYDSLPSGESPPRKNKLFLTTSRSTYNLFASLYFSSVLTSEHSEYILSELTKTSFDIKGFANLPESVIVAQKYGDYYGENLELFHSCGILYSGESRFFYCVVTKDLSFKDAQIEVGAIVHALYEYIQSEGVLASGLD